MKIVFISDTHNNQPELPPGDLLIHSGDLTMLGTSKEVKKSLKWLGSIRKNYTHGIVLVPGNHDWYFEHSGPRRHRGHSIYRNQALARKKCDEAGVTLLIHESTVIGGIKIFGSPYTPHYKGWAFNRARSPMQGIHLNIPFIGEDWRQIPDDTQLLVTHGPPFGVLDAVRGQWAGCEQLIQRIRELKDLKIHAFGHIHEGAGHAWLFNKLFVNGAVLDGRYNGYNDILVIDWNTLEIERKIDESV